MLKRILFLLLSTTCLISVAAAPFYKTASDTVRKPSCADTLILNTAYSFLCCKRISYKKQTVHIRTIHPAQLEKEQPCYRLVVYPCNKKPKRSKDNRSFVELLFAKLAKQTLFVNDSLFTGSLRLAVPFYVRFGRSVRWSGHNLHIFYFKEGRFLRRELIEDIHLENEMTQVRRA